MNLSLCSLLLSISLHANYNPLEWPYQHGHMFAFGAHASSPHSSLRKGSLSLCLCKPKEIQLVQLLCVIPDIGHIQVTMIKIHLLVRLKLDKTLCEALFEIYSCSFPQAKY